MARKKEEETNELFELGTDELDEVLAGLPSQDSTINLFRVLPQGSPSYVTEFAPSDFSLEAVKNTYGGGKYKYVAKSSAGVRAGFFVIDGESKVGIRPVYKRYINGKLVFSKPDEADVIVGESPRDLKMTPGNESNVMLLLLTEIRSLREGFQRPQQTSDEIKKNFLEEMMVFKTLFGQQNPVQDFSKVAIDLIKQGMEVATMSENGGSPWMMIIDKIMPAIQETLKMVTIQQQRAIPMPDNVRLDKASPGIETVNPILTGFDAVAGELQPYLPTFIRAASIGTDPMILVDMTIPNISDGEMANKVISWLESDVWLQDLVKLHPAISAQAAWWGDYRIGLLETLKNPRSEIDEGEVQ
jgi:hypothetical protein